MMTFAELYNSRLKGMTRSSYGTMLRKLYRLFSFYRNTRKKSIAYSVLADNNYKTVNYPVNNKIMYEEYLKLLISIVESKNNNTLLSILNQMKMVSSIKNDVVKTSTKQLYILDSNIVNTAKKYELDHISRDEEIILLLNNIGLDHYIELLYLLYTKTELDFFKRNTNNF